MDVLGNFNEGVRLYRSQEWDKASHYFREALKGNKSDNLSTIYIERCVQLKKNPPSPDWDGVWVMKNK